MDKTADFRAVLINQWKELQLEKGWCLGGAWRLEKADFFSPDDQIAQEEERTRKAPPAEDEEEEAHEEEEQL